MMMKPILYTATMLLLLLADMPLGAKPFTPEEAIASLKDISASTLDPRLPRERFGNWLQSIIGKGSTINWQTSDCGIETSAEKDLTKDLPTCVEAEATLKDGRTVVVVVDASRMGSPHGKPVVHWISVEKPDGSTDVQSLRDLQIILGVRSKR